MADRIVRTQGTTGTLTRPTELRGAGGQPLSTTPQLSANAALGASSITVDAVGLAGTVPALSSVAIAGDATAYTTTAAAKAVGGSLTLQLTPVLAAAALENANVTIAAGSEAVRLQREELRAVDYEQRSAQVKGAKLRYLIAALGMTRIPDPGDTITVGGETHGVYDTLSVGSGAEIAYYDVMAGDA
jgi:hypothetical protein